VARLRVCDNCGSPLTPSNPVVAKLFLVPTKKNDKDERVKPPRFNGYTAHMDIGACCAPEMVTKKRWQKRQSLPQRGRRKAPSGS